MHVGTTFELLKNQNTTKKSKYHEAITKIFHYHFSYSAGNISEIKIPRIYPQFAWSDAFDFEVAL